MLLLHIWRVIHTVSGRPVPPSTPVFRESSSRGRICAGISQQAKLDSWGWCRTGLKSIMISLSGSLNNAKLFNRTHSLMAEIDKNHFTHWRQTACLFIQYTGNAEWGWNMLHMVCLKIYHKENVFYMLFCSSGRHFKILYPSFFDLKTIYSFSTGTAVLIVNILSLFILSRFQKLSFTLPQYTLPLLHFWLLRIKMCCQVTEASVQQSRCLCCTHVSISRKGNEGGVGRDLSNGTPALWSSVLAAMRVFPPGDSVRW